MKSRSVAVGWMLWMLFAWSCQGQVGPGGSNSGAGADVPGASGVPTPGEPPTTAALPSALRRLTRWEMANVLRDLLGDASGDAGLLPVDARSPESAFDNEWPLQNPSDALISGAEQLANVAAARAVADPDRRDALVGCTPDGPGDEACFRTFLESFGRRALRRPLDGDDLDAFVALQELSREADDFYVGVETALSAFLQHPRLLYRIEVGELTAPGSSVSRLDSWEIAARLSFLLWGTTPDDWLLDEAASGDLDTDSRRREIVMAMLVDPRAEDMTERYHELWLGYEDPKVDAGFAADMRTETNALVRRIALGADAPWSELFLSDETFVSGTLAEHYGLSDTAPEPAWRSYDGTERLGILSHGTLLAPQVRADDTDPTQRGLFIRSRLLCQVIQLPANVTIDDDFTAPGGTCKPARLAQHKSPGCEGCHRLIDPIGFGFEQYDQDGRFRDSEEGRPDCEVDGAGEIFSPNLGSFQGPAGLARLLANTDELASCMVEQYHRFASGRFELEPVDANFLTEVRGSLGDRPGFDDVVLAVVMHPSFVHRHVVE